jgi:hypothetical protein
VAPLYVAAHVASACRVDMWQTHASVLLAGGKAAVTNKGGVSTGLGQGVFQHRACRHCTCVDASSAVVPAYVGSYLA